MTNTQCIARVSNKGILSFVVLSKHNDFVFTKSTQKYQFFKYMMIVIKAKAIVVVKPVIEMIVNK